MPHVRVQVSARLVLFEFGQNDPKMDSGVRLCRDLAVSAPLEGNRLRLPVTSWQVRLALELNSTDWHCPLLKDLVWPRACGPPCRS